jgi:hypothetical protein
VSSGFGAPSMYFFAFMKVCVFCGSHLNVGRETAKFQTGPQGYLVHKKTQHPRTLPWAYV